MSALQSNINQMSQNSAQAADAFQSPQKKGSAAKASADGERSNQIASFTNQFLSTISCRSWRKNGEEERGEGLEGVWRHEGGEGFHFQVCTIAQPHILFQEITSAAIVRTGLRSQGNKRLVAGL